MSPASTLAATLAKLDTRAVVDPPVAPPVLPPLPATRPALAGEQTRTERVERAVETLAAIVLVVVAGLALWWLSVHTGWTPVVVLLAALATGIACAVGLIFGCTFVIELYCRVREERRRVA